jgi:hypothetical protein
VAEPIRIEGRVLALIQANRAMSVDLSWKSKTSMFCLMRSGLVDRGTAITPSSMCQRNTISARASARSVLAVDEVGSDRTFGPRPPSGDQASVRIPC